MRRLLLLLVAFHGAVSGLSAQSLDRTGEIRLFGVRLDPPAPAFGEPFDTHLTVRLPGGVRLLAPDTVLPTEGVQSVGQIEWNEQAAAGDSVDVHFRVPLIAYLEERVELPLIPLWLDSATLRAAADSGAIRRQPAALDSVLVDARYSVHLGSLLVEPFSAAVDGQEVPLTPRGAEDVLGGDWSVWLFIAVGLLSLAGIGGAGAAAPRVWQGWGGRLFARLRGRSPRQEALRDLERIRASGWHRNGRIDDFYAASTDALRRYVGRVDPRLAESLTSGELLQLLQQRLGPRSTERLEGVIGQAERTKFGTERPDPAAAEGDWETIRNWVRDSRLS